MKLKKVGSSRIEIKHKALASSNGSSRVCSSFTLRGLGKESAMYGCMGQYTKMRVKAAGRPIYRFANKSANLNQYH